MNWSPGYLRMKNAYDTAIGKLSSSSNKLGLSSEPITQKSVMKDIKDVTPTEEQPETSKGMGLKAQDGINIGLMALGAMSDQKEAERAQAREDKIRAEEAQYRKERDMADAKQRVIQNQQQERSLNLQGFDRLTESIKNARDVARRTSFRNDFSRALGGM